MLGDKLDLLMASLGAIADPRRVLIAGKPKLPYSSQTPSSRRSRFTGVFKNGARWQALIAIQKRKTYIATFDSALDAAKAYDLVSIVLNNYLATTNFDYSKEGILSLITSHAAVLAKIGGPAERASSQA